MVAFVLGEGEGAFLLSLGNLRYLVSSKEECGSSQAARARKARHFADIQPINIYIPWTQYIGYLCGVTVILILISHFRRRALLAFSNMCLGFCSPQTTQFFFYTYHFDSVLTAL
jgi:hypothetical protein